MELHTCNNLSSMKKVVFGHLLKRPLSLHFLCSLMGVRMYFLLRRIYYTSLFFSCPSTQSADMEKTELNRNQCLTSNEQCNIDAVVFQTLKAFVTVDHTLPSSKLDCYGITGPEGDWFRSYLQSSQSCVVNGCNYKLGKTFVMSDGPQRIILGPLLFVL